MALYTLQSLAKMIDHTNLHMDATAADIKKLCQEARDMGFGAVVVNPSRVKLCKELLEGSGVRIGAVVGFPLGASSTSVKLFEACDAIADGADEIDFVVNVGAVKDGDWDYVKKEMTLVAGVCREKGATSKVIFENCYLTDDEKVRLCQIASEAKPDFVKTSTGFGVGGAKLADVILMKENVAPGIGVKAAGGIRTTGDFMMYVQFGATRIGCSAGVPIIQEFKDKMARGGAGFIDL